MIFGEKDKGLTFWEEMTLDLYFPSIFSLELVFFVNVSGIIN